MTNSSSFVSAKPQGHPGGLPAGYLLMTLVTNTGESEIVCMH